MPSGMGHTNLKSWSWSGTCPRGGEPGLALTLTKMLGRLTMVVAFMVLRILWSVVVLSSDIPDTAMELRYEMCCKVRICEASGITYRSDGWTGATFDRILKEVIPLSRCMYPRKNKNVVVANDDAILCDARTAGPMPLFHMYFWTFHFMHQ